MDESNHITAASGFDTRVDDDGKIIVMQTVGGETVGGADTAEHVVETKYPVDATTLHKVNPDNADLLEDFCTSGELEELSKIGHIIIGLEASGACPIIGQSASGYASSLAVVDNAMYEWDLAGQPAEIAEHQATEWGDMWDSSYFNMEHTNDQGETEQMIASGTENFDDRYTAHLYGTDSSNNISNLGWGNAGFGTSGQTASYGSNMSNSFGDYFGERVGSGDNTYSYPA